jgi:hypothetical protein
VLVRLGAAVVALAAGAAGIVVVVLLLRAEPSPTGNGVAPAAATPAVTSPAVAGGRIPTPTSPGFPSPPPGALVLAQEAGDRALGLGILPGGADALVRVSVLSADGPGARGLAVSLVAGGRATSLPACGAGCYQAEVPQARLHGRVVVRLGGTRYPFSLPASLSLPSGTAIVAHATSVWRHLKTLIWHERLGSSLTDVIFTTYYAAAPDELQYTIRGHSASIIIGEKRWDRSTPTSRWVASVQDPPITQPVPFWASFANAHVLGSETVGRKAVWNVTFFDPQTPAWFDARIDKATGRTLRLDMIAVAHFMHHVYGPFDRPFHLKPPR